MDALTVANRTQVVLEQLETLPVSKLMETCLSWEWVLGEINVAPLAVAKLRDAQLKMRKKMIHQVRSTTFVLIQ